MQLHYLKQNHQRTVTAIHTRHSIQAFTQTLQAWKEQQRKLPDIIISGRWSHVVYTVSKDGVKTYIDGDLSANQEVSLSEALSDNKLSDIDDVRIGSGIMSYLKDVQNAQFDNIEFIQLHFLIKM